MPRLYHSPVCAFAGLYKTVKKPFRSEGSVARIKRAKAYCFGRRVCGGGSLVCARVGAIARMVFLPIYAGLQQALSFLLRIIYAHAIIFFMNSSLSMNTLPLHEAVSSLVAAYRDQGFFPFAVIRVFTAEETLCSVTVGDVREGTLYDVASLTKIATATQVLQAVHDGMVCLDSQILDILPALRQDALLDQRLSGVTVYKLLTHTSSIVDWYPFYTVKGDFTQALSAALKQYAPVEGMVYSDLNFMLLGKVLEKLHAMPLEECLRRNLAMPLGLGEMTYCPDPSLDIAPSCFGNPIEEAMCAERGLSFDGWRAHEPVRGQANDGNAHYYFGGVAGSAGIFATADAYQRLCQFHMRTDIPVFTRAQTECAPGRGLGWQLGALYPQGCGHTGFTGTSVYLSRLLNIGVVAFTNRLYYPHPNPNATNAFRLALHEAVVGCLAR